MMYFAPLSPSDEPAMTAVGSPRSQPCIPIRLIYAVMMEYPIMIDKAHCPSVNDDPSTPPTIRQDTHIIAPAQTIVIDHQLSLFSELTSKPVFFSFMILTPFQTKY
jgi:hypothetical protein